MSHSYVEPASLTIHPPTHSHETTTYDQNLHETTTYDQNLFHHVFDAAAAVVASAVAVSTTTPTPDDILYQVVLVDLVILDDDVDVGPPG